MNIAHDQTAAESKTADESALKQLRRVSAEIGSDIRLIQGAGGNTSVKFGDVMWIKASGTWLAEATDRDIMVPVALPPLLRAIENGDAIAERAETFTIVEHNASGLRPSVETSMHAALAHAVVLHVHSVDAVAIAVREDAHALLTEKLAGLRWASVPYRRPGLPLTCAIAEAAPGGDVDVLILGNHGLVVAADDVTAAETLLADVVGRLAAVPRSAAPGAVAAVAAIVEGHGYRLPVDAAVHTIATDPTSLAIAERGALYPDHVVFLGGAPLAIDQGEDLAAAVARWEAAGYPRPKWIIVRGVGVALDEGIARGGDEMARCLADVAARIPAGANVLFLSDDDVAALTNWDGEKYRQQLARAAGQRV